MNANANGQGSQKRTFDFPELESLVVVSCTMLVLKPNSSSLGEQQECLTMKLSIQQPQYVIQVSFSSYIKFCLLTFSLLDKLFLFYIFFFLFHLKYLTASFFSFHYILAVFLLYRFICTALFYFVTLVFNSYFNFYTIYHHSICFQIFSLLKNLLVFFLLKKYLLISFLFLLPITLFSILFILSHVFLFSSLLPLSNLSTSSFLINNALFPTIPTLGQKKTIKDQDHTIQQHWETIKKPNLTIHRIKGPVFKN